MRDQSTSSQSSKNLLLEAARCRRLACFMSVGPSRSLLEAIAEENEMLALSLDVDASAKAVPVVALS